LGSPLVFVWATQQVIQLALAIQELSKVFITQMVKALVTPMVISLAALLVKAVQQYLALIHYELN